jgi:hypothetical protein
MATAIALGGVLASVFTGSLIDRMGFNEAAFLPM